MIVNSQTPPQRLVALRQFFWEQSEMTADCWDVDLNGGLRVDMGGRTGETLLR